MNKLIFFNLIVLFCLFSSLNLKAMQEYPEEYSIIDLSKKFDEYKKRFEQYMYQLDDVGNKNLDELCTYLKEKDPKYLGEADSITSHNFMAIKDSSKAHSSFLLFLKEKGLLEHIGSYTTRASGSIIFKELDNLFTLEESIEFKKFFHGLNKDSEILVLIKFIARRLELKDDISRKELEFVSQCKKENSYCNIC